MEKLRYFLGANSPKGFYGYFQKAYDPEWRVWLIKGGPGSGKSTLMRQVAQQTRLEWEYIHCSSDPKSLDAIICEDKKVMIADATAPHTMEAMRPGCVEQLVDLGAGFAVEVLRREHTAIDRLFAQNALLHRQAVHYLAAAAQVQRVRKELAAQEVNKSAVCRLADRYAAQICDKPNGRKEKQRGLSAVTPDGIVFFADTVKAVANTIYTLADDWGAAAPLFLETLHRQLDGYGAVICRCSLFPEEKIEHILLPQSSTAYVTANMAHPMEGETACVDLRDMYGTHRPGTKDALQRILAQEKQLLEAASGCMYQARLVHDELENYYIHAMDFTLAQRKADELTDMVNSIPFAE